MNHLDPAYIVKQNRDRLDSGRRTFKIADKTGVSKIDRRQWTRTILDVRFEDAAAYCQDITTWARSVLAVAQASATL